jgi:hypothetical protein
MVRFIAGKIIILAVLASLGSKDIDAQSAPRKDLPRFLGREVTIVGPKLDADGFPTNSDPRATICLEGLPRRQCYTSPQEFWKNPAVSLVQVQRDLSALLFSVETWGASGWQIRFALLRPGTGKDLEDLFLSDTSVSNQSQYAFWNDFSISDAQIFVTADFVWGPDEGHYDKHRYIISAYRFTPSFVLGDPYYHYHLEDRYMTIQKYAADAKANILAGEKQEIIARLRRVKAETERQPNDRH